MPRVRVLVPRPSSTYVPLLLLLYNNVGGRIERTTCSILSTSQIIEVHVRGRPGNEAIYIHFIP